MLKRLRDYLGYISAGDVSKLLAYNRKVGLIWIIISSICMVPFLLLLPIGLAIRNYLGSFFCLICVVGLLVLCIHGVKSRNHPESHYFYKTHYANLCRTVSRNTGCMQRSYVPEEWEIPLTEYSEETLSRLLNAVGAWGADNACFICNRQYHRRHGGYITGNAVVLNWCEKGLFLVPIFVDENKTSRVCLDITMAIPPDRIKSVRFRFVNYNVIWMNIKFKYQEWDPTWLMNRKLMRFRVNQRIDGADFHEANVAKLYAAVKGQKEKAKRN